MFSTIDNAFRQANAIIRRRAIKQTEVHVSQIFAARTRLTLYIIACGTAAVLTVISLCHHATTGYLLIGSFALLSLATWLKIEVEVKVIEVFSEWEQNVRQAERNKLQQKRR